MLVEMTLTTSVGGLILGYGAYCRRELRRAKIARIQRYPLPESVKSLFLRRNPSVPAWACRHVWHSLQDYFCANIVQGKTCKVPSVLVDKLWETFTLSEHYSHFCKATFGKHIHYTPLEHKGPFKITNWDTAGSDFKEVWQGLRHPIAKPRIITVAPDQEVHVPLLFVVDSMHYPDGFRFSPELFAPA